MGRLILLTDLNFSEKGLIPAIVQDEDTGDVLMLGYMNQESLRRTLASGEVWFFSRSRQELWHKGATSGNKLKLVSISKDCEDNSLLVKAYPVGPTCHTGHKSCFYRDLDGTEKKKS
jgi:phosphoribosyl-ATP pyrophosphohydrolase/phosphoribosyl-AMP cyclohydrolase